MTTYNLALLGFGNVGRAFVRLLQDKTEDLRSRYGLEWRVTGVATRRLGWLANPEGLDPSALQSANLQSLIAPYQAPLHKPQKEIGDWLSAAGAAALFENTSLDPQAGQPAIDHIRAALEFGAHAITANKGPVVHAYRELRDLARARGKRFLFEATVMGGAPIFSTFREALPATNVRRFRGLLNSTTNLILTEMEAGLTFDEAVKKAQAIGIAETDPSADVDGWDATVKVSALATVLMDAPLKPDAIQREGIRALTPEAVRAARAEGRPFKLICRAERAADGQVAASVRPEQIPAADPLASVNGPDSMVTFETDTLHSFSIGEQGGDPYTTAYGLLADFVNATRYNG